MEQERHQDSTSATPSFLISASLLSRRTSADSSPSVQRPCAVQLVSESKQRGNDLLFFVFLYDWERLQLVQFRFRQGQTLRVDKCPPFLGASCCSISWEYLVIKTLQNHNARTHSTSQQASRLQYLWWYVRQYIKSLQLMGGKTYWTYLFTSETDTLFCRCEVTFGLQERSLQTPIVQLHFLFWSLARLPQTLSNCTKNCFGFFWVLADLKWSYNKNTMVATPICSFSIFVLTHLCQGQKEPVLQAPSWFSKNKHKFVGTLFVAMSYYTCCRFLLLLLLFTASCYT